MIGRGAVYIGILSTAVANGCAIHGELIHCGTTGNPGTISRVAASSNDFSRKKTAKAVTTNGFVVTASAEAATTSVLAMNPPPGR